MTRWEYKVIIKASGWTAASTVAKTQEQLNQLGREGWELVSYYGMLLIFKRPA